jgi:hypothetical protein
LKEDFKSRCACSAGGIGICLCVIFMSLAVAGTTAVGILKNADVGGTTNGMSSMSSMSSTKSSEDAANTNNSSLGPQNIVVNFFSGFWGQVILLLSFGAMFGGIWFGDISSRKFLLPITVVGAAVLYVSMYNYYSIALEIIGVSVLAFVYASIFSHRIAKMVKVS